MKSLILAKCYMENNIILFMIICELREDVKMSRKISKCDAYVSVVEAEEAGRNNLANKRLEIIQRATRREKAKKLLEYLEYLEINDYEEKYFKSVETYHNDE